MLREEYNPEYPFPPPTDLPDHAADEKDMKGVIARTSEMIDPTIDQAGLFCQYIEDAERYTEEHAEKASKFEKGWVHKAGIIIRRDPLTGVAVPPKWAMEDVMLSVKQTEEEENRLSTLGWRVRNTADRDLAYLSPDGQMRVPDSMEEFMAMELLDYFRFEPNEMENPDFMAEREAEWLAWKKAQLPLPIRTPDEDNMKSLWRRLDEPVFLMVRKKRKKHSWQPPQRALDVENFESLRRCAYKSAHRKRMGTTLLYNIWDDAPIAHAKYVFPERYQEKNKAYGAKVFYYYGQHVFGNVSLRYPRHVDYAWMTMAEVKAHVDPALYEALAPALHHEYYSEDTNGGQDWDRYPYPALNMRDRQCEVGVPPTPVGGVERGDLDEIRYNWDDGSFVRDPARPPSQNVPADPAQWPKADTSVEHAAEMTRIYFSQQQ